MKMVNMKLSALLAIVLLSAATVYSQSAVCDLGSKDSPEIRGIKLGMSEDDIGKVLGWTATEGEYTGLRPKAIKLEGIENAFFDYYKGKLYRVEITYDRSVKWNDSFEFADALAESWKLPAASNWKEWGTGAVLKCKGFVITARSIGNSIVLIDAEAVEARADEAKQKEADKKKAFKP